MAQSQWLSRHSGNNPSLTKSDEFEPIAGRGPGSIGADLGATGLDRSHPGAASPAYSGIASCI